MKKFWHIAIAICAAALAGWYGSSFCGKTCDKPSENSVLPVSETPNKQNAWLADIQREIAASEYHIRYQESANAYQSPNRAQNLRVTYHKDGFTLTPRTEDNGWKTTLRLKSIEKGGMPLTADGTPKLKEKDNTLKTEFPAFSIEYVNTSEGMRQNFIVNSRPEGNSPLAVRLMVESPFASEITDNGNSVLFRNGTTPVLEYKDLKVWDADGARLDASMQLAHNSITITVDDRNAKYPVTIDPLSTIPNWTAESEQEGAMLGYGVSSAGDVNNDSYSDMLVGVPYYDGGEADEGAVFVYHGSVSGFGDSPDRILESNQAGAHFGFSVAKAGNLNGDAYGDVVIGAPDYDNGETDEGRVFVYRGSASGLSASAAATRESNQAGARFGYSVSSAGRINADALDDVIVGAPYYDNGETDEGMAFVYWGDGSSTLSGTAPWTAESQQVDARMGLTVAGGGDFNRDGRSDIAVGIPLFDNGQTNEGTVYVYYGIFAGGLPLNPNWIREGNQNDAQYGYSVASAGDISGDGYDELLVGAPFWSNGEANEGRAFLYRGRSGGLDTTAAWTDEGNQINARYGHCVASAGDVNNDGNADIIIGAPLYDAGETDEGRAYIYLGSTGGVVPFPNWIGEGNQVNVQYGTSVASIGDINHDSFSDFAAGAPYYDNGTIDEGRISVYYGSGSGIGSAMAVLEPNKDNSNFGFSVASAGDVNGDGFSDLLIGAPGFDGGIPGEGKAFLYYGSANGVFSPSSWGFESNQANAQLGASVSAAGDVNGDNYSDIIIAAPLWDSIEVNEGRVWIFHGGPAGIGDIPAQVMESNQSEARFGTATACAGDVNNDGFSDVAVGAPLYDNGQTDEGQVFLYGGSANGLRATAAWTGEGNRAFSNFGASIANANDVNGDGFSDIIIGAPTYNNDADAAAEGTIFAYYGRSTWPQLTPNWQEATDQDDAKYGASVASAGDINGDGYADIIVGAPFFDNGQTDEGRVVVYYGGTNGMQSSNVWIAELNQANAHFGTSVAGGGDINGDGYADITVGAPQYTNGQLNEGGIFIYLGTSSGPSVNSSFTAESDQTDAAYGTSVANLGDINGDGYSDIGVGAPKYDNGNTDEGRVYVYAGHYNGLSSTPTETLAGPTEYGQFGVVVSPAGDVNGDGYADIIVSSPYYNSSVFNDGRVWVYYGNGNGFGTSNPTALSPTNQEKAYFGWSAASAGDVNNDGFADIVVGAPGYDVKVGLNYDQGRVYVFQGSAAGINTVPAQIIDGEQNQEQIGMAVAGVGDANNDGYSDIAAGASKYSGQFANEGKVVVYYGSSLGITTTEPWIKTGGQIGANFGASISAAGDVNRDGINDVIIGAPYYTDRPLDKNGRAYMYLGATGGLSANPAAVISGKQNGGLFGYTVANAGDVNGDGYSDALITSLWYDSTVVNEGRVWLYNGTTGGLAAAPSWHADGGQIAGGFGTSVSAAGDLNGDGYGDVIIGADMYDNGSVDEGRAVVYFGSDTSLTKKPVWTMELGQNYAYAGGSVAGLGDINGDGYPDIAVGARGFDASLTDRGSVSIFYGNNAAGKRVTPRQWRPGSTTPIVPVLRSQNNLSADLSLWGRSIAGRGDVKAEFEAKSVSMPFNGSGLVSAGTWTDIGIAGSQLTQRAGGLNSNIAYKWRGRLANRLNKGAVQRYSRWYAIGYNSPTEADFRTGLVCTIQAIGGGNVSICEGSGTAIGKPATGAVGAVTYSWTPTTGLSAANIPTPFANPDSTTTYIVTALDNNSCLSRDTVTVTVLPKVMIGAGEDVSLCPGDTAYLSAKATGGTPNFQYEWSPAGFLNDPHIPNPIAKPVQTITYVVKVTDRNGCYAHDTVVIRVHPAPTPAAITRSGDSLVALVPAVKYQWYVDNKPIAGATAAFYIFPKITGTKIYKLETTDQNGCRVFSNTLVVTLTGVEEDIAATEFALYPVPAGNEITVKAWLNASVRAHIVITNSLGKIIASFDDEAQAGAYSRQISLENLAAGSYIISVRAGEQRWLRTFIKE
ncbi:MAG: FG-GAP-like repeat-containing protein [Bacteroidetes bacterium]|nr:FG-GAP repeat protein [Bacteroidota bacterium]MCZ2132125.1 FG-GAP-like repeat-containing protein [Bacteroidota bacterium]